MRHWFALCATCVAPLLWHGYRVADEMDTHRSCRCRKSNAGREKVFFIFYPLYLVMRDKPRYRGVRDSLLSSQFGAAPSYPPDPSVSQRMKEVPNRELAWMELERRADCRVCTEVGTFTSQEKESTGTLPKTQCRLALQTDYCSSRDDARQ